jgi:hypothetical protein
MRVMYTYIMMHRTQILIEEDQYERLKGEADRTGRSIGDLVREAIDARWFASAEGLRDAFRASRGAWSDLDVDGETYVERIRQGLGERLQELGWD